jgi:hypothetical protein
MIDVLSFSWSLADKNVPHRKIPLSCCHVFTSTCSSALLFRRLPAWAMEETQVKTKLHMIDVSQESMACTLRWCAWVSLLEKDYAAESVTCF